MMKKFLCVLLAVALIAAWGSGCKGAGNITVSFDGNGGVTKNGKTEITAELTVGKDFVAPEFEKDGFVFIGWDKKLNDVNVDTTVKALWQIVPKDNIKISFNLNGGTLVGGKISQTLKRGESAVPPETEREGYVFNGWRGTYNDVENSAIVTAEWTPVFFDVVFDPDGGEVVSGNTEQKIEYGKTVIPPCVVREGYVFDGWDKPLDDVKENLTVKAKWIEETEVKDTYTVTFDLSERISEENLYRFVEDTRKLVQSVPKGGTAEFPKIKRYPYPHYFKGWDRYTGAVNADITVKALWEEAVFTISFDAAGGKPTENSAPLTQYTRLGKIENPPSVEKPGYIFRGWTGRNSDGDEIDIEDVITGSRTITTNCTFTALWSVDGDFGFDITFDGNGGKTEDGKTEITLTVDSYDEIIPPEFFYENYELLTWSIPLSAVREHCLARGVTEFTVSALWREIWNKKTAVTFDGNGGEIFDGITVMQGKAIPKLPVSKRAGYVFEGWYYETVRGGINVEIKAQEGRIWNENLAHVVFRAKWREENKTAVIFDSDGGTECKGITLTVGSPVPELPVPEKGKVPDGDYTFLGWYYNDKKIEAGDIWTDDIGEVTFLAKWRSNWTGSY